MRVIPPLTITDARLTSSSVAEPDTGEAVYNPATTYALDDVVIDTTAHRAYQSLIAGNVGQALTDTAKWLDIGPTNRWKMFDLLRNTGTTSPSPLTVNITPGVRVDSLALVGLVADEVTVTMTSGATVVYSRTIELTTRDTVTWKGYFFGIFRFMPTVALFDLPPYTSAVLTVELSRATGDVECGGLILGTSVYLGETLISAESDARNFSTVDYDAFGNSELIVRRSVPKTSQTIIADKAAVNLLRKLRDDLNAVPAFWSWLDDQDDDYFDAGVILGPYTQFMLTMDQPAPELVTIALQIQEV